MSEMIHKHLDLIHELCRHHHVERLWLFGSMVNGGFSNERSDADFLVEYRPGHEETAWEDYWGLREGLQAVLDRPVDLVDRQAMRNPYVIRSVEASREVVYAA